MMKKVCLALALAALSELASAAFFSGAVDQNVAVDLLGRPSSRGPDFPYQRIDVQQPEPVWQCGADACELAPGAKLNVVLRTGDGAPRAVQYDDNWASYALSVFVALPDPVQDPLGGLWQLLPDLADWRYGVHVSDNIGPDQAQFMTAPGMLSLRSSFLPGGRSSVSILPGDMGWIETGPSEYVEPIVPNAWELAEAGWLFSPTPLVAAPAYALASLDPACMSTTCMRYERGTLMVDAHRLSFGVQAVAVAVPEPATWAGMSLGLLALGAAARRRRVH